MLCYGKVVTPPAPLPLPQATHRHESAEPIEHLTGWKNTVGRESLPSGNKTGRGVVASHHLAPDRAAVLLGPLEQIEAVRWSWDRKGSVLATRPVQAQDKGSD